MSKEYKSLLHQTVSTTATDYWNDSCSVKELTYAIENGAVGATSNPTIVLNVIRQEMDLWIDRLTSDHQGKILTWSEVEITWKIFEEIGVKGANLLQPVFEREKGKKRPAFHSNQSCELPQCRSDHRTGHSFRYPGAEYAGKDSGHQGRHSTRLKRLTYHGININATVCFTVPQSLAVAEAVERGLEKDALRKVNPVDDMTPVCTIMVGRMDDWLKVISKKEGIVVTPGYMDWAGVACMKKAYEIYQAKGYRTRLLAAAYRHHLHWTEFIGGDIILTIPYKWQKLFNSSDFEVKERMADPVSSRDH